jgi:PIN domain nuclease of toxin-antitoxin system
VSSVVLDASALIAFLRSEPGSDIVGSALADAAISSVNLSEVLAKAAETPTGFEAAKTALRGLPLRIVPFDEEQAVIAAGLRPMTRPLGLSLGDRCCLALGLVKESPVLTTDRQWSKLPPGVQVRVIR